MPLSNPNHHLWRNGRLWWVAFTVIYDGWRQERVRRSLGTAELDEARRRRDELFQQYAASPNAQVTALARVEARARQAAERIAFPPAAPSFGVEADAAL